MDMSDLMGELNNMADNIDNVQRWQELFNYTYEEASQELQAHRLSDIDVTDGEWAKVSEEQKRSGHDRESYAHLIQRRLVQATKTSTNKDDSITFLFILQRPLDSVEKLQGEFSLNSTPASTQGTNDDGDPIKFCKVSISLKQQILERYSRFQERDFIANKRLGYAPKCLSDQSRYPTLGIDTTLPQYRPANFTESLYLPLQDQYPVWYFFYGTLGEPERLSRLLQLAEMPEYYEATVLGGKLTTWGGKYNALIDGSREDSLSGVAYEIHCQEDEMSLQVYETNKYEVVRVDIKLEVEGNQRRVPGLAFRYTG